MSIREKRQGLINRTESSMQSFDRAKPQFSRMGAAGGNARSYGYVGALAVGTRSIPKTNEASIWVGNLPEGTTADDIRAVAETRVVSNMTDVYVPPGNRGFGFMRFAERGEAEAAAKQCEGMEIGSNLLELKLSFSEKTKQGRVVTVAEPLAPYSAMGGMQATPKTNEASVWVGSLPSGTSSEDLRESAESHGISHMTDVYVPPGDRGFGFLRFAERRDAEAAMRACEGLQLGGNELEFKLSIAEKAKIGPAVFVPEPIIPVDGAYSQQGPDYDMGYGQVKESMEVSVKISNLPAQVGVEDLRQALRNEYIDTMSDVYIPRGRSFGFVRFRTLGEAQACLQLNGMQIWDNRVVVELADGEKKSSSEMAAPPDTDRGRGYFRSCDYPVQDMSSSASASRGVRDAEVSLKVSNIPLGCTPPDICEAFATQGVDSMTDCYIPRNKGYAFLRFASMEEGQHVLEKEVWMQDRQLEIELAQGSKRSADEMQGRETARESLAQPVKRMREMPFPTDVPDNPEVNADTPSVRVSRLTVGASSEELHAAFCEAGCSGRITDVYVPKGNRGYGFVRFSNLRDAEDAVGLSVYVRGHDVDLELAVANRKTKPAGGGYQALSLDRGGGRSYPPYGPARRVPQGSESDGGYTSNNGPYRRYEQPDDLRWRQDYRRRH